ncbi:glycosyltransferase family 4 protein [Microbacterium sp. NEAU-LLC]|uniref:D-inositol 3-phosphate glycosyltransferase n=1 Tax=Microbacterium helvum TaxID=2773713 RepID=A0ABR8NMM7_9MICO|nr:glycosyltransferase family 4 protein [Microbacterium helvum]
MTFVVPDGIDDPLRVSGGNVYDRRVGEGLRAAGWDVSTVEVRDAASAARALRQPPPGATVLIDGLVAGWAPAAVEDAAERVRVVVLAHMVAAAFPDVTAGEVASERAVLAAAHRVVVTSAWTARELGRRGLVDASRVSIASPGAAAPSPVPEVPSPVAGGAGGMRQDRDGRHLLCVGVVAPHKGQDVLLAALAQLPEQDWTCAIVGSPDAAPRFAAAVRRDATRFHGRVRLTGVLGRAALAAEYGRGGLLVAPSRVESAGMAIAEARARGIPVVAADVGGIPDTVAGGGAILVRPDDAGVLAAALHAWMSEPSLRQRLRREARAARQSLPSWNDTAAAIARVLEEART